MHSMTLSSAALPRYFNEVGTYDPCHRRYRTVS